MEAPDPLPVPVPFVLRPEEPLALSLSMPTKFFTLSCPAAAVATRFAVNVMCPVPAAERFWGTVEAETIAELVEAVGRAAGAGLGGVCENGQRKALHVLQSGHKPNNLLDGNMASRSRWQERERGAGGFGVLPPPRYR